MIDSCIPIVVKPGTQITIKNTGGRLVVEGYGQILFDTCAPGFSVIFGNSSLMPDHGKLFMQGLKDKKE